MPTTSLDDLASATPAVPEEGTSKPAHPDAQYQGRSANLTSADFEARCGRSRPEHRRIPDGLIVEIQVARGNPEEWGDFPIKLWVHNTIIIKATEYPYGTKSENRALIEMMSFQSLAHLEACIKLFNGPFKDFILAALDQIKPERRDHEGLRIIFVDERVREVAERCTQS